MALSGIYSVLLSTFPFVHSSVLQLKLLTWKIYKETCSRGLDHIAYLMPGLGCQNLRFKNCNLKKCNIFAIVLKIFVLNLCVLLKRFKKKNGGYIIDFGSIFSFLFYNYYVTFVTQVTPILDKMD